MRRHHVAAALLSVCLSAAHAWAGATLDRVSKTGTVTDILVNDYPPFSYIDDNNQLAGFDVDVAKAFADRIGAKLSTLR